MSEAVLVALGDLTNGALNYYQTPHVVMVKRKVIETYIEHLQQENKILRENAEHNDKVVDKVNWENQQLKEVIEEVREYIKELYDNTEDTTCYDIDRYRKEFLLQILDKAKENK